MQEHGPLEIVDESVRSPTGLASDRVAIVGVGASAGGLDAFTRLLRSVPADTGYSFVLVQHLDAKHPSSLSEILGRATRMPVADARDGTRVKANHVYVIPPNTELTITDRVLRLNPRSTSLNTPIDRFLQSLARDCGSRAVGVVLSGSGSDGAAGLVAIKEAGGVTFAQEPSTAEYPSMPTMAAASGGVDVFLPPEAIAAELARFAQHPHFAVGPNAEVDATDSDETQQLRAICDIMHEATGIDFALYRESTVYRRVQRRLALRNVASLSRYARMLAGDSDERVALQRDLLIGVTRFFRDPESFEALKRLVFPAMVRDRAANKTIRIWVPGCSSGEEPYSILMALQEYQSESQTAIPVQVFASDISDAAIEKARAGKYPDSISAVVSPERLRRHFSKIEGGYQIAKELRERCIFSRHNLLDDPPFSKLDLISCRNVLIYLDAVQKKIIPVFHYALEENGFLMLGRSETAHFADLFAALEPRLRIYAKKQVARRPYGFIARAGGAHRRTDDRTMAPETPLIHLRAGADLSRDADRILLSKYSPAGVLVDEGLEVLEIRGRTEPFLKLMPGKVSFHLVKLLADTGLFLEVEKLTHEVSKTGEPARRESVAYEVDGVVGHVHIEVTPIRSKERRAHLILFESVDVGGDSDRDERARPSGARSASANGGRHVTKLKRELREARQRLVSVVEEHETSDQENQQVTEDALSANEELQSLTEELETAKEELQSTNEELITVNRDLEVRNLDLASARDFAKCIVETVGVPLVVVDSELRVRHLNASFVAEFKVSSAEAEGLPLYSICDGALDTAEVRAHLERLRTDHQSFEPFEVEREFPFVGTRVLLMGGCHLDHLDQLLLTFNDVTTLRETERALIHGEEQRREAEKMEAVGRLAGGIAHDFNNLLTVIIGYCALVADTLERNHEAIDQVDEIRRSAERAAALTEQLLAFSRRKILQPKVFDLNPLVLDFERMLGRLLGEKIHVAVHCAPGLWLVKADPGEIGRVVMNLCLNSRDAMPAGGTLSIETSNANLDTADAALHGLSEGRYVRLVVRDTGIGMDPETRKHAFEPFYTTKDVTKGSGLGLSTVFGIIKQSGGATSCASRIGRGTRFAILLPVGTALAERVELGTSGVALATRGSKEVILLVEDEDSVRVLARRVLEKAGYVVLEARDGLVALAAIESHEGVIDALVSDVMMPELGGTELAERALALRPDLKVLFMSGHTEDVILKEGVTQGMPFLQKPYTPAELSRKVRELLDSKRSVPSTTPESAAS